jgi:hypothetical protein
MVSIHVRKLQDIDLYQEENNPANSNKYAPTGFDDAVAERTIKVKDSSDVVLTKTLSSRTPQNDLIDLMLKPVVMSWIYTQQPLHI